MKKHLALVLALVMVLSSFSFVSAAPDFSDIAGTSFENAVNRLELLEILKGYPDGTFKPENSITRAEFAAVAVRAQGLAGVAEAAAGLPSGFSDVPSWHWAAGYVGTAGSMGVVQGIGNGLFAPDAPVKYEEAITMLVRALGYEPEAQSKGGYPFGYLVVAEEIGLLDDARGVQGTFADRGLVAKLTDNALEIPMMVSIGFGDNIRWVVSGSRAHGEDADAVYLLNKLGVDEFEGIVMENFHVGNRLDENEIKMYDLNDEKNVTLEVMENVDVNAILGLEVTAWAKDDVVFAVTVETDAELIAYDSVADATEDDVELVVLDDTFDWAEDDDDYGDAVVYVNNVKEDLEDAKGFGRIVMNDDDEVVFAYLFDVDAADYGVVVKIDEDEMVFVSIGSDGEEELDLEEAEAIYGFNKEFSTMSIEDIEAGMSVFFWVDEDDEDDNYYMVAFEAMVEGELEEVRTRDSRLTVDGTNYSKAADAIISEDEMDSFMAWLGYADVEDYIDEEVVLYLDLDGKVMLLVTGEGVSSTVYGLVTWFSEGRVDTLSVFTKDGEEVTYDAKDRTTLDEITSLFGAEGLEKGVDPVAVELELNRDGEIDKVVDFEIVGEEFSKLSDRERVSLDGTKFITKDTVILKAYDANDDELKASVIKYEDIVDLAVDPTNVLYIIDEGSDLALLIFVDPDFQATDDTMYAIATGDRFVRSDDYRIELDVFGEGKAVYTIVGDDIDVKKGDLVTFKMNNNDEAVLTIETKIADYDDEGVAEVVDRVLTNFVEIDGTDWRVMSDTLFYKVDSKGKLDGTTTFSRIDKNDQVLVLVDEEEEELKVIVDLTPALGQDTPEAAEYTVTFNVTTPAAVTVTLGDKTDSTSPYAIDVVAGTYNWSVSAPGYVTTSGSITVDEAETVNIGELELIATMTYTSGKEMNVQLGDGMVGDYAVIVDDVAYGVVGGVANMSEIVDGRVYTAQLVDLDDMDTVIFTLRFIADVD